MWRGDEYMLSFLLSSIVSCEGRCAAYWLASLQRISGHSNPSSAMRDDAGRSKEKNRINKKDEKANR